MNRRSILRLETLEDRLTPAVKLAAPIVQPATVNHTTTTQTTLTHSTGVISVSPGIALMGPGAGGGSGGGSGSGGTTGGSGSPIGP